jgi:hypothetical protein
MLALVHRITARIPQLQRANLRYFLSVASSPSQRRYALSWLISLQEDYLLRRRQPWLTYDAIQYLTKHIGSNLKVFEFGSGGSTLFWAERATMCVSVEHDPGWVARLRPLLSQAPQVDLRLVPPRAIEGQSGTPNPDDFADPTLYLSSDPAYTGLSFRCYASQIDSFPDGFFDVVLVDGRARPSCVAHSVAKVREGGLFILDNANIPHYLAQTQKYLSDFDVIEFFGVAPIGRLMAQTNVYWRRKASD